MQLRILLVLIAILALATTAIGCPASDTTEGTGTEAPEDADETEIDEPSDDEDPASLSNPVVADIESIARGEEVYLKTCVTCHGESGLGDGSASSELVVNPANLTSELTQEKADGEIFDTITNGRQGTPMPAWKGGISPEDRWNLVNYIRTLTGKDEPEASE